jgi:hypothetical protein
MKNLAILLLLLATPAQANPLMLICTGKTLHQRGGETEMYPLTAILDLDKLTFRPPWSGELTYSITKVTETEISFSVKNEMLHSYGTLDRVTGQLRYSTDWHPPDDKRDSWSNVGFCKPSKPLF